MKEFDPQSQLRFHPLVSYEGIILAKVPLSSKIKNLAFPIIDPTTKQVTVVSVPKDVTVPILPIYVYDHQEIQILTASLLILSLLKTKKDFLTHDFIATPNFCGPYLVQAIPAEFDSTWEVPPDEEMVQYILEKRNHANGE